MGGGQSTKDNVWDINMRLIILLTLAAIFAFALAKRRIISCPKEEKICPGGIKPRIPCADGSSPRCLLGRADTCKPEWKRCADQSKPLRQCETGKPRCASTTMTKNKLM